MITRTRNRIRSEKKSLCYLSTVLYFIGTVKWDQKASVPTILIKNKLFAVIAVKIRCVGVKIK